MPVSEAHKRARNKYDANHYFHSSVKMPIEWKDIIKRISYSTNGFIVDCIRRRLEELGEIEKKDSTE